MSSQSMQWCAHDACDVAVNVLMIATTMCERSPSSDYFFIKIHCIENRFPKAIKIVYGIFSFSSFDEYFFCVYLCWDIYFCNNFYDIEKKQCLKIMRRMEIKKDWYGTQDQQHTNRHEWETMEEKMKDEQRHNETSAFIFTLHLRNPEG